MKGKFGNKRPKVSVVITAYGNAEHLNQAVDSVIAQSFTDYELIIVDDCSDDSVVSDYAIPGNAVFIRRNERFGAAAGPRNDGIKASSGEYLAFLDFDDVLLPHKLESQSRILDEYSDIAFTYCHYTAVDDKLAPFLNQDKPRIIGSNPLKDMLNRWHIRTPSCVMARRSAIVDIGMFDDTIVGASDLDMWLRMVEKYHCYADPKPGVLYRIHHNQLTKGRASMRASEIQVYKKALARIIDERPECANQIRRKLSNSLCRLAREQYRNGNIADARSNVFESRKMHRFNISSYILSALLILKSK